MAAVDLVQAIYEVAKEDLSPGIRETLPKMSQLYELVHNTWEGVERNIGRPAYDASGNLVSSTFVYRWIWAATGGGAYKATDPAPNIMNPVGHNVGTLSTNTGFPSASDFVMPRFANPFVGLKQARGLLALPVQLLRYGDGRLDSVVVDVVKENIKASAELTAVSEAVCYLSRNPSWGECLRTSIDRNTTGDHRAVLANQDLDGNASTGRLSFKDGSVSTAKAVGAEDTINCLRPGMSVDVWEVQIDENTTISVSKVHSAGFVVDTVDYINSAFSLVSKDGASVSVTSFNGSTVDALCYIITLKDYVDLTTASTSQSDINSSDPEYKQFDAIDGHINATNAFGPDGLLSFIKTKYTDKLYGIPLVNLPTLLSREFDMGGNYLTEHDLNDKVGLFRQQYGVSKLFDTLILQWGVLNGFIKNLTGTSTDRFVRLNVDRANSNMNWEAGWERVGFKLNGRVFRIIDDPTARRNNVIGIKTRDKSLKRLMPPPLRDATGRTEFQDVEFVGKLGGATGDFLFNRDSSGAIGDEVIAPYIVERQHFTTNPCSLRMRNVAESIG